MKKCFIAVTCLLLSLAALVACGSGGTPHNTDDSVTDTDSYSEASSDVKSEGAVTDSVITTTRRAVVIPDSDSFSLVCLFSGECIYPVEGADDGIMYFMLPQNSDLKSVQLTGTSEPPQGTKVMIGSTLYNGEAITCDVTKNSEIEVSISYHGSTDSRSYAFVTSSSGSLYLDIDEKLGQISAMNSDPSHETSCFGVATLFAENEKDSFTIPASVKGRGNATWTDEKKGYTLSFYNSDSYDEKEQINVCGMGKASKWVLVANHRDRTLLRNSLALTLAQELELRFAVEYITVDLYINGKYNGLYTFAEKIERDGSRVDIELATDDNLDGGYLLEFDNYYDTPQIQLSKNGMRVTINSPSGLESYTALEKLLNETDEALRNKEGINSDTGKHWYEYVDIESFAKLWIIREYTLDYDANVNFHLYYDPEDGKLYAGPAWDFDNSMARNNGIYNDPDTTLIASGERNGSCWLKKLLKFDDFKKELLKIYNENIYLFTTDDPRSLYSLANSYRAKLETSITMNFNLWNKQLSFYSWNMPDEPSYDGHFDILTEFLDGRNAFWAEYIPDLCE